LEQWVFGGLDTITRKCFLVPVDRRDRATLLPIIQQYVLSDEWAAYRSLRNNPNYIHLTLNHSVNLAEPTTSVHTQNIENTWMRVERKQKRQGGMCSTLLPTYLEELMWRQDFGDLPFKNRVSQISVIYPVL
ncbi:unnamed protein product, partial [Rotaria sp. Silwood1]